MKPSPLRYHRPTSVAQCLDLLAQTGDDGKVLAGGQSLVPLLSMRLVAPRDVVDVNRLPGLDAVDVSDDAVRVGALVRHSDLEHHDGASAALPLLRKAIRHVAHPTIRNRGTVVGSVVHADPSGEMPAVLTLLGGSIVASSTAGERTVAAADLYAGPLEATVRPDELVVAAVFPRTTAGTAVAEIARRHGDYAVCGVVASVRVDAGVIGAVRACFVSAGEMGTVVDLSAVLAGQRVDDADWDAVGAAAASIVATEADIHSSADYRTHLVAVLTIRAVRDAARDAR